MFKGFCAVLLLMGSVSLVNSSCKKRTEGICYCSYFSGDKREYDLRSLERQAQKDSCAELSRLASGFAGSCKLK